MNASEFLEQLERDREALLSRRPRSRVTEAMLARPMVLDRLTRVEAVAYDTGAWLGPVVPSAALHGDRSSRVQLERQEAI